MVGWFIWLEGEGPLMESDDGSWALVYERDEYCAYRIGGAERLTALPSASIRDRWIFVAVAKDGPEVTLWIDDRPVDVWDDAPVEAPLSTSSIMKHAVGYAADIALFERRLPDERLSAYWNAGKSRV